MIVCVPPAGVPGAGPRPLVLVRLRSRSEPASQDDASDAGRDTHDGYEVLDERVTLLRTDGEAGGVGREGREGR